MYKISTPVGGTYSKHKTMSEAIHHTAEILKSRGIKPTVHEAMEHGFSISRDKEHQLPHWKEK